MLHKIKKASFVFFAALLLFIVSMVCIAWVYVVRFQQRFEQSSQVSLSSVFSRVQNGWEREPILDNNWKHILLLGVDEISGRPEGKDASNVLTDSMIVLSLNIKTGKIVQFSLPRDLWVDAYKTKINALYHYGFVRTPNDPTQFVRQVMQEMTGVPIHHAVVLRLSTVAEIIDALGGIDVDVERSFEDNLFPRPGIDVATVRDPKLLYQAVQFTQGVEHMSGERALIYVRSRHSEDAIEKTDEGRIARQKRVIQSLLASAFRPKIMANPERLGRLYAIYFQEFDKQIPLEELVATARMMFQENRQFHAFTRIKLSQYALSIQEQQSKGVLFHPSNLKPYGGQWVYIPAQADFSGVKQEIRGFYEEK